MGKNSKVVAAMLLAAAVLVLVGCQQDELGDMRKCRLIAAENAELKGTIEQQKQQLAEKDQLLQQCQAEKNELVGTHKKQSASAIRFFMGQQQQQQETIKTLENKIEQLEKQLEEQ